MAVTSNFPFAPESRNGGWKNVWYNLRWFATKISQGSATITVGNSSVIVSHGLGLPPQVSVTPTASIGTRTFWVSNKTVTQFTINLTSAAASDTTFDWLAKVV